MLYFYEMSYFTKLCTFHKAFYSYSYSYSYYCVINQKNVCCYLVSEIGILGNMRAELSFDD